MRLLLKLCIFAQSKLEQLGRRVGATMVEQMTRDIPRFKNELDVLVFVCKQFWQQAWHKPVDNLKTNHQVPYTIVMNNYYIDGRMCMYFTIITLNCYPRCLILTSTKLRQL